MNRVTAADVALGLGLVLLTVGVALVSVPAALIVDGLLLLAFGAVGIVRGT